MKKLLVWVGVVVLLGVVLFYSGHSRIEVTGRTLDAVSVIVTIDTWARRLAVTQYQQETRKQYEVILKMKVMTLLVPLSVEQLQRNEDTFKWLLAAKAEEYGLYLVRVKVVLPPDVVEKLK